ncbi:MAG: hydrogenase/urease maturation nickel metallochaperone HypA [Haemophilus parainfluenzae]|nr:hydrogenase/urease maturation nickel metallochaperone HypA [Haemophilus parainfluenzae]MDU2562881.1 hydrogenase/urease maturation nickel metallochaperone HypA [Haemophilus parainfluenzae]
MAWCWQCQKEVEIEAYQDCCPHCHSACLQRRSGTEFRVKEIAVK